MKSVNITIGNKVRVVNGCAYCSATGFEDYPTCIIPCRILEHRGFPNRSPYINLYYIVNPDGKIEIIEANG